MAQYDALAQRLTDIEEIIHFYRKHIEFPSFLRALGSVRGKRILDVGCGDGVYARMVAEREAEEVVATDSSAEMVALGRAAEKAEPLGVRYEVHDVSAMPVLGSFDVAVAVNVLHYADGEGALVGMCERIAANLAPGGRLLAYVGNVDTDPDAAREFGFVVDLPEDRREGAPFTVSIAAQPPATVSVHYWPPDSLVRAVESAGFTRVGWEDLRHTGEGTGREADLDRLLKSPPSLLLSAYRA
ncbi:Ubiquinone biosynthesis O-methyltransferase [Streptomyces sp. RB5]|uniref:Ubiquinone biosynthesis O-methyltransferase n=1 Tax=Streptomyces smaragdinus TaxID=2585196 RepID=A0A7K0CT90_9ACTN|nr:class I SAM-dependent methyltransferase [Streptomyces smaragdinus]MQY16670.1 Ubiquinone biosynthesis O-methyltransferase [Streptomyces smaragdinus]